ncbi:MAG TPA: MarR family transcriptional regulator [Solirubrobacteraceae bacterium]|jgi:DNA-binding MarR family transcriptional regulator|nr:MarR family transcriptional regulator [Solirubrobacteraceae bacterium]
MTLSKREPRAVPARLGRWPGFQLARAHVRAHAAFQEALAPLALTPKSFGVLVVIIEAGPLSQAALGETLFIDRTTIVAVVDELERAGYVERGRDSSDRRVHSLHATPAGRNALGAAEQVASRIHDEILGDLDGAEREQLAELLARIAGAGTTAENQASPSQ